ncbi:LOW QUALITY PROTEIN: thiosulfate sulfurtransferase 16, chloroplastic [Phoenix dactylifera]|uniref:LOW QUALITY PROTEIN: thiosulfate sulfurtransferase 16, chloroplastic n=1 Tax=Phoenix dactylifera TaxID=42345 RepID=A0A8B8ZWN0_PHODC|nr:LOW QUALITY PROTEIN: thiosulfate sulfurtransferase 16, chloroplastic [Phoenix dactylifera]
MAASCFTRFSLPPYIPSSLKRAIPLPATLLSSRQQFRFPNVLVSATNRRPIFLRIRSMSTDGSPEAVEVPRSVPVNVAHELLQDGHRYLDVRTPEEFKLGHPVGATNIPYMLKSGSGMTKNPNFLKDVSSVFEKNDAIIVGCLSGKRSLMAATELSSAGFTGITDIAGGYSAWVQNGLPTEQ